MNEVSGEKAVAHASLLPIEYSSFVSSFATPHIIDAYSQGDATQDLSTYNYMAHLFRLSCYCNGKHQPDYRAD